ncbi:unnamed protein product [Kluyveromyces dobzhanskii CBS 2104]|uniref:Vacuolar fusion protein MON1 n=1 Tax=Kluyveromyces dobzhanskii CBS 2104 TaxID=1427455 RepID=A0A0A8L9Q0_9SACH|nr:unnamed protein product [Kluyveromyces dobzhanskii CBS 2104]
MEKSASFQINPQNSARATTSVDLTNHLSARGLFHSDADAGTSASIKTKSNPESATATISGSVGADADLNIDLQSLITSELNSIYPATVNQSTSNKSANTSRFIGERTGKDKHFFIFTSAGKLVFSQWENESHAMGLTGIIHTVMNYFNINDNTSMKQFSMYDGDGIMTRFVFADKNHIKLMVQCSNNYESTAQLQQQLDLVYSYIISSVSQRNLNKLMMKRSNFDLQHYLTDLDQQLLQSLCDSLATQQKLTWFANSLECLPMTPKKRNAINTVLSSQYLDFNISNRNGQILYTLVTSLDMRLISILRPSNHTLHTIDLQILFELVQLQLTDLLLDKVLWFPICFPKFNDNGFLYALIKVLPNRTIIMVISSQKNAFETLNEFVGRIGDKLMEDVNSNNLEFPLLDWHKMFPCINHFVYKMKRTVQIYTPFQPTNEMLQYYNHLKNLCEDDQGRTLNKSSIAMLKWKNDTSPGQLSGLYWTTEKFELYILLNDINISNQSILRSAKRLIQHMREVESYLFISRGVTF